MNALPRYQQSGQARFDFRVPDGLGDFVYPDWSDPLLRVEFYDADSTLAATATVGGTPALTQADDYDADDNPEGGAFVTVEAIELADFALGVVEARVYAKVENVEALPYPTLLSAFEVEVDLGPGPLYSTVDRVKDEVPGAWPSSITDHQVALAISDASRKIDAYLATCYETPFADVTDDPPTPAALEAICRKLAAYQCLEWMGRVNAINEEQLARRPMAELTRLVREEGGAPLVRLPGYQGPAAVYQGTLGRSDDQLDEDAWA